MRGTIQRKEFTIKTGSQVGLRYLATLNKLTQPGFGKLVKQECQRAYLEKIKTGKYHTQQQDWIE